jgi:hypothetical protein
MAYVELDSEVNYGKKILIFVEGTILKPKSILLQYNYKSYVPIGKAVSLIERWYAQGAAIVYCTYQRDMHKVNDTAEMLKEFGFKGQRLYYRADKQEYKDLVEMIFPDILVEDDCYSIGGAKEMCITNVPSHLKDRIRSVVVKEFKGIDQLPSNYLAL